MAPVKMSEAQSEEQGTGQDTLAGWCAGGGTLLGCIAYVWGAESVGLVAYGAAFWLLALGYVVTRAVAGGARPLPSVACIVATTICTSSLGLAAHFARNASVSLAFCLAALGLATGGGAVSAWRAAYPDPSRSDEPNG